MVRELVELAHQLEELRRAPGFGSLSEVKPQGAWRIMYVQANGLAEIGCRKVKLEQMMELSRKYDIDGIMICEVGVNWKAQRH